MDVLADNLINDNEVNIPSHHFLECYACDWDSLQEQAWKAGLHALWALLYITNTPPDEVGHLSPVFSTGILYLISLDESYASGYIAIKAKVVSIEELIER